MNAEEITKQVEEKEKDFNDLFVRMDADFELWNLTTTPVIGSLSAGTLEGEHTVQMVSNRLRTFADEVHSKLAAAERQIAVRMAEAEGEDKREDMGKLERLFEFALEKADERLIAMLVPPLREQIIWYSSIDGWAAARILVESRDKGKTVIFNFTPLDPRWLTYEVGSNGFLWVAYKTFRSKVALADEYKIGEDKRPFEAKSKNDNAVIDYWKYESPGKMSNAVICDKTFLKATETYNLPSVPILIMPVATRPPLGASGSKLASYGDSIFAPIRDSNKLLNQVASIVATHANLLARQPTINYYDGEGKILTTTAFLAEAVVNLPMGHNKLGEPPMKEISPTIVHLLNWLEEQVESGSLPRVRVGQPPQSGTLENLVQEARNIVFNPQLRLLNSFYAGICRLIEEQLLSGGVGPEKIKKVKVQIEQKNKYYETEVKPVDLKKPHIVKVEFTARTPWQQLATAQVADMLKRAGLPDSFLWEYIYKFPDPKGLKDQVAIEMAEHSPKLAMLRSIIALKNAGRDEEAGQLIEDMYNMAMQEQVGAGGGMEAPAVTEVEGGGGI